MKKAKGKKKVVLTPLQKANRKVRELTAALQLAKAREINQQSNHEFRVERLGKEEAALRQTIADKQKAIVARDEAIAQRDATIRLRDERIVDLTNERNRIVHIVDQFTSVQITSHGTEMRVAAGTVATPDKLRLGVPPLVAAKVGGGLNEQFKREMLQEPARESVWERASKYRSL